MKTLNKFKTSCRCRHDEGPESALLYDLSVIYPRTKS